MVNESGDSSWQLLQNIYSPGNPETQAVAVALALTKNFLKKQKIHGACRVHGGGFAGTIQAYIPLDSMSIYNATLESVFGAGSVTTLQIRQTGATELFL
jgi:galactokinase